MSSNEKAKVISLEQRAVLWDLDGTLVDTEGMCYESIKEAFQKCTDVVLDKKKDKEFCTGKADIVSITDLCKKYKIQKDPEDILKVHFRIYDDKLKNGIKISIYLRRLVRALKKEGHTQAIVSGSTEYQIRRILQNSELEGCFQGIYGIDSYKKSKPDPASYLYTMKDLTLRPEQCIAFEDSKAGISAAKRAGVKCITVKNQWDILKECYTTKEYNREYLSHITQILISATPKKKNTEWSMEL